MEVTQLKDGRRGCWILCGDFNFTRCQSERKGKNWSLKTTSMFNDLIRHLEVLDLPLKNQAFTWSNLQSCPTLAELDRFLISTEWDQQFPLSDVVAIPRITSDHCPILLSTGFRPKPKLFRLEEIWLQNDDFVQKVPVWWKEVQCSGSAISVFNSKIRHCRK